MYTANKKSIICVKIERHKKHISDSSQDSNYHKIIFTVKSARYGMRRTVQPHKEQEAKC